MNYDKKRAATEVLTTFKKIDENDIEEFNSKAKNNTKNQNENFENLNKIFGSLSNSKSLVMLNTSNMSPSSVKVIQSES